MKTLDLEKKELKHRIEARRKHLQARLEEAKASAASTTNETIQTLRTSLEEVNDHLKDGWDNLTEQTLSKLNEWLAREEQ